VLSLAARRLPPLPAIRRALATLRALADNSELPVGFDLAELRGYHYHSGVVFDAYCAQLGGAVARGGRYDEVGKAFGRPRPATGFSIDLRALAGAAAPPRPRDAIRAPCANGDAKLAAKVAALRAAGAVVIEELPGHARHRRELGCTRELVLERGTWVVKRIGKAK
jgi:ATP phosphoribosyltransferase regulatory subunit